MTHFREHRLIHRTLASLDEQRKAAGLAPLATPVGTSPRSAQANAQVQQQQYSQKSATAQAGSAQVKAATEANFAAKKTISDLSSLYENGSFTGTSDQMAELNDAQGKLNYTNKTLDAQSNIAANAADTSGQKTLDALALGGQQQTYDAKTGITQLSGEGNLEQSAITRLRESGLNDQQIAEKMKDPEYMNAIRTTMSNTGLESTARQSAVLTPAQAQNILATSRNPKERAAAQKLIDDQVNNVKGYDQVPQYNKDGQIVGYSNVENTAKTQENQQKEKERLALEESNRLKAQESKDALKKFTAGIDTAQVDQTKTQIDELMASIKNLSPDLQAAVLPSLISLQQSNNDITKEVNNIISSQPTDEEIQANYGSLEKYIQSEDAKYKALIGRNMETSKEVATYNRDMLEAEKAIIEHDASVAEQKQVIANAEGEKQLRRQLNRLGIQTDVQGLTYLQNEVQKGVDALENLKTANNLVSLKAQLAIGEGYRLEVKQAMETYEGNYLNITSQTTERLNAIKNSISTAKADRNKEIKEARKWGLEQKNLNDRELRATISKANDTMAANLNMKRDDDRAQEQNGYQRLNWAIDTYGVNVPKALVDEISKMMPNVDVQSIISTPTAAALKASRSGGSGSNLSFPSYMQQPGGQPPSFETFLAEKEKQALASGANSFDTSSAAMAAYQKEYETRSAATKQYNPTEIVRRFKLKAGTLTGPNRNYAQEELQAALDAGDYEFASQIVDNTGDDIPAQQANDFTQALNARYNVKKLATLFDDIGTTYPGLGKVRQLNPLDDRVVQYQQNLTQTIPGLARGIFKEVGVLTDTDIDRYTSAMANPNLTVAQAQNAFNDLSERIDVSIQNQLNVWDAGKKAVGGFKELYKAEPINAAKATSPTLSASQDYAQSLLSQ